MQQARLHGAFDVSSSTRGDEMRPSLDELLRLLGRNEPQNNLGPDVMQSLGRLLGTDVVIVHALAPDGALRLVGSTGLAARGAGEIAALSAEGLEVASQCAAAGDVIRLQAAALTADSDRSVFSAVAAADVVAVPLFAQNRTRGVLTFVERNGQRPSGPELEAVAVALGLALATAANPEPSPCNVLQRAMRVIWDLTDFWALRPFAFAGPQATLTQSASDIREFLEVLAERARELVGAELAAVGIGSSPDVPFEPWVAIGMSPETVHAIGHSPRPVGTLGTVAIGGETIRVANVHDHPAFRGLPAHHPELRSLLAVPLRFRDQSVGNLYLANKRGATEFDRMDQYAIEILGTVGTMIFMIERDRTRLHQIVDGAPDGVLFLDAISGHVMANHVYEELFGGSLKAEKGLAQELGAVLTPEGVPLTVEELPSAQALAGKSTVERELIFVRPDATRIAIVARATPIRSADGAVIGAVSTFRDDTRRAEALKTIERQQRNLRMVLDAAPDGILFFDARTQTVLGNPAFEQLLGRSIDPGAGVVQELGGIHWPHGGIVQVKDFPSQRALDTGERVRQELRFVRANGSSLPVEAHAAPIRALDGTIVGVVVTYRDLSLQKELERIRQEFSAMVAHDLRNPIQSILIQTQMLQATVEDGRPIPETALDRLSRLAHRMGRITGDLLDSVRIDLARVALDRAPRDAVQAVRDVVGQVQPSIGDHPIRVEAEGPGSAILIDPTRFEQILANLLENAAKYSETGAAIDVSVKRVGPEVEIAVRDRGKGISPDELPLLFDRFYQTERARKRKSGLGLGLYIAKGFVEAHGGRLTVESVLDRGSTFHVFLPTADAAGPVAEAGSSPPTFKA